MVVDAFFAELIDDDGIFFAVALRQNSVEKRGFSGPKKTGQYGYGHFCDLVYYLSFNGLTSRCCNRCIGHEFLELCGWGQIRSVRTGLQCYV